MKKQKLLAFLLAASMTAMTVAPAAYAEEMLEEVTESFVAENEDVVEELADENEEVADLEFFEAEEVFEEELVEETEASEEETAQEEENQGEANQEDLAQPVETFFDLTIEGMEEAEELEAMNTEESTSTETTPITKITNTNSMFKVVSASIVKTDSSQTLSILLSGTGYHHVFCGSYEDVVATGTEESAWIKGTEDTYVEKGENKTGYRFELPISDDTEMIPLQVLSYKTIKTNEYKWYSRYLKLDQTNVSLETGDQMISYPLKVDNQVNMFGVKSAEMSVPGSPNNTVKKTSKLIMKKPSFDKAFIGTAMEAQNADSAKIIPLETKDGVYSFDFTLETKEFSILGKDTIFSFYSVNNQCWYERILTYNEEEKTLLIVDSPKADYSKVNAAIDSIPTDLSIYTEETVKAVTDAKDAVRTDYYVSQQSLVDELAKNIQTAVAGLTIRHTFAAEYTVDVKPTCTKAGSKSIHCTEKGHTDTKDVTEVPALGHSFGAAVTVKEATVLETGISRQTCSACGATKDTEIAKEKATIKLNVTKLPLKVGQSAKVVKVTMGKGDAITSWKSSNSKIVSVDKNGKMKGLKEGKATITVTLKSKKSAKITVTVSKKKVTTTKIKVAAKKNAIKSNKMSMKVKGKDTLVTTLTPLTSADKVTFATSDKKIVTVDKKGNLVAKKKGTAKITVTSGKKKVTIKVTVKK